MKQYWYDVGYRRGYDGRISVLGMHDTPNPEGQAAAEQGYKAGQHDKRRWETARS